MNGLDSGTYMRPTAPNVHVRTAGSAARGVFGTLLILVMLFMAFDLVTRDDCGSRIWSDDRALCDARD